MERFLTLASRIRYEIWDIQHSIQRAQKAWILAHEEANSLYLDSVALNIHNFYSGLERIFELIAENIDGIKPQGAQWHQDLLRQMSMEIPGVRPAVISLELRDALDEYRAFRHIVRNVYAYKLRIDRIKNLMERLEMTFNKLVEELEGFCSFLEKK